MHYFEQQIEGILEGSFLKDKGTRLAIEEWLEDGNDKDLTIALFNLRWMAYMCLSVRNSLITRNERNQENV